MSIRSFLTLVIAVMGFALLAIAGSRMMAAAERNARAKDVAALTKISQSLLPAFISARIERGTVMVTMMSAGPVDEASLARLAENRPITDRMAAASAAAFKDAPLPRAAELAQQLMEANAGMQALRAEMDAAIALPLGRRDLRLLDRFRETSANYLTSLVRASDAAEDAVTLFDPEIDRLVQLKRAAWAARNFAGLVALRIETSGAVQRGWTTEDAVEAAEDQGRADLAWQSVLGLAAGPAMAEPLRRAIAAVEASQSGPEAQHQRSIILGLQAAKPTGLSVSELQRLNTDLLNPLYDVLREAMAEMVEQATRVQDEARMSLLVNGALLVGILCLTGLGIAVVHERISSPIRRITQQMARLTELDTDFEIRDVDRNDEIGEMARALVVFRQQVEERGRRLQEREMRQFLETLIDAMPVSITFKDTDLRYRYVNRARRAEIDSGGSGGGGDLVGKRLSEVMPGESAAAVENADRQLLQSGEAQEFEQARSRPDGRPAIIWSLKTPFRDADGGVRGIITCGVDITRLKQIEAELIAQRQRAEAANRAKSAFLASMSHELRTPLNAIIGFADMLAEGYLGRLVSRQQEYVGDIRQSGEHLLKMVNDLLDLSSLEIGRQVLEIGDCNFDTIAVAALSMVQPQAEKAGIRLDFAPTEVTVRADERALTQILVNLLGNAIKFSPEGGHIALRALRGSDGIRIQVADTGIGMTEAQRVSALAATIAANPGSADPYKARPKGGAGLGLAICRRLIEQHNGTLEIESRRGAGSTVNVVLPAA